jgi:uncharacterized phage-associated protein
MAHVQDVAAYILQQAGPMTAMKLQKLCYFSYGYHLVWDEERLFPERFEAWANGPVCFELYDMHRGRFNLSPGEIKGDPWALSDSERESVSLVLGAFNGFTAHQLSAMTHREGPWVLARERCGVGPLDRCDAEILDDEIAEYFEALASADADGEAEE